MPKIKAISPKEKIIIGKFYKDIQNLLNKNFVIREKDLDMKSFQYIISISNFKPREYIKIFHSIPREAQLNILKGSNVKTEDELKNLFKKKINIYNQEIRR